MAQLWRSYWNRASQNGAVYGCLGLRRQSDNLSASAITVRFTSFIAPYVIPYKRMHRIGNRDFDSGAIHSVHHTLRHSV